MIFENEIFQNNKCIIKKVLSQAKKSTYYYSLFEKRKIKIEEIDTYEDLLQEYIGVNYARKKILGNLPQGKYVWIWIF
ncbi:hypothetical protein [Butyrivibrio sp. NC3005]|uniref:hypothetical protein n=1 Tax=Butyrivibrio sp. NC3005 TaxID=1280685 RepID=UPI0004274DDF|nr:hypothetical protein [Butyrivibrio sp. NC3005]